MRALIVTADDVGLHRGMTAGAIQAHREGIVTACSVAACGEALDDAAAMLPAAPALEVGAHLMLVEGRPVLPPERIPTLTTPAGRLLASHREFLARYLIGRIDLAEVELELRAQLTRLASVGLRPVHVNSHQHLHLLPSIFGIVVRLAHERAIPYVRIVRDLGPGGRPLRRASVHALGMLGRVLDPGGLRANERTIGVHTAGRLSAGTLVRLLDHVEGLTELVTHPGIGNRDLSRAFDWGYDWDAETAALCDPAVREGLERRGIGLRGTGG